MQKQYFFVKNKKLVDFLVNSRNEKLEQRGEKNDKKKASCH